MTKTASIFLTSIFLFTLSSSGANINAQVGDPIHTIRQRYASINKQAPKYRKVKKELSGFSLEGGELAAYLNGPAVMKIVATHFGESGRATEEYYYWKGKLIFVFRKDFHYDQPMSGKVVRTAEHRFYFNNDRLIRWIDENGRQLDSETSDYQQKQNEYLESSRKFVNGALSKNPTIEASNRNQESLHGQ